MGLFDHDKIIIMNEGQPIPRDAQNIITEFEGHLIDGKTPPSIEATRSYIEAKLQYHQDQAQKFKKWPEGEEDINYQLQLPDIQDASYALEIGTAAAFGIYCAAQSYRTRQRSEMFRSWKQTITNQGQDPRQAALVSKWEILSQHFLKTDSMSSPFIQSQSDLDKLWEQLRS